MSTAPTFNVAVIGCGMISETYVSALQTFPLLNLVACADLNPDVGGSRR